MIKNIKLLALDLDGTLTNSKKEVSKKNKEYIHKAQSLGVRIVLASGRPLIGIKHVATTLDMWNIGGYILAYNGGEIIDCATKRVLFRKTIPLEYISDICRVAKLFNVFPLTHNSRGVLCENNTDKYVLQEAYNNSIDVIKVKSLVDEIKNEVVKFMVVGNPDELQRAYSYYQDIFKGKLNISFSEPYFLEITAYGIEKSTGLLNLLKILNYKSDSLMACGDGLNDISMLKVAGVAVAMGNAYSETKKYADFITKTNEDDGVAYAIEKIIL